MLPDPDNNPTNLESLMHSRRAFVGFLLGTALSTALTAPADAWFRGLTPANYFVSPAGSDSNDGKSINTPWQTLSKVAASTFKPGDTIAFQGSQTFNGTLILPSGGSPIAQVTYTSYGVGEATIQAISGNDGIDCVNLSFVTISNLTVTGAGGSAGHGIFCQNSWNQVTLRNVVVQNCTVTNFAGSGIRFEVFYMGYVGFDSVSILNCVASHNTFGLAGHNRTAGITVFGQAIQNQGTYSYTNLLISGCTTSDNTGVLGTPSHCGSGIYVNSTNVGLITGCLASNNGQNCNATSGPGGIWMALCKNTTIQFCESASNKTASIDGVGFDIDGGCTDCAMQYNYSHDNAGCGFLSFEFDRADFTANTGIVIRFNISRADGRGGIRIASSSLANNGQIYGNTIYCTSGTCLRIDKSGGGLAYTISNNIFVNSTGLFVQARGDPSAAVVLTGNCYYSAAGFQIDWAGVRHTSYASWQTATNQEKIGASNVGFNVNPGLVGLGSTDLNSYKLTLSSPLLNNGVDLYSNYGINPAAQDYFGGAVPKSGPFSVGASWAGSAV
jgi:hypothetical protein